ncbi:hypothetical protein [Clostridium tagluense]|uniref:Uncharacterized protein n=1 Tax=Clostridium tagluense TaxID=360422 RepID=A0A401ULN9_9CLOT|nr:hypothetical protein [Clostridium tagluense]GCD10437.1 hypothetical protein Ctaglu_20600 [Clostridium tagluense]
MATPFYDVYDNFFLQIGDDAKLELLKMTDTDLDELLYLMLRTAIVKFKRCKKLLPSNIDIVSSTFLIDLDLEEILILSEGMTLTWLNPRIIRLENLRQSRGDRDFKTTNNSTTLYSSLKLRDSISKELNMKITSYTYNAIKDLPIKK